MKYGYLFLLAIVSYGGWQYYERLDEQSRTLRDEQEREFLQVFEPRMDFVQELQYELDMISDELLNLREAYADGTHAIEQRAREEITQLQQELRIERLPDKKAGLRKMTYDKLREQRGQFEKELAEARKKQADVEREIFQRMKTDSARMMVLSRNAFGVIHSNPSKRVRERAERKDRFDRKVASLKYELYRSHEESEDEIALSRNKFGQYEMDIYKKLDMINRQMSILKPRQVNLKNTNSLASTAVISRMQDDLKFLRTQFSLDTRNLCDQMDRAIVKLDKAWLDTRMAYESFESDLSMKESRLGDKKRYTVWSAGGFFLLFGVGAIKRFSGSRKD